eukprot:5027716-Prymnesium_polylepis.3
MINVNSLQAFGPLGFRNGLQANGGARLRSGAGLIHQRPVNERQLVIGGPGAGGVTLRYLLRPRAEVCTLSLLAALLSVRDREYTCGQADYTVLRLTRAPFSVYQHTAVLADVV